MTYRIKLWKWEQNHCSCDETEIYMNYNPVPVVKKVGWIQKIMMLVDGLLK